MAGNPHPSDAALPENSRDRLDRKLDHAIQDTFPTSDPVSVTITKGGAIDYDEHGRPISGDAAHAPGGRSAPENLMAQAKGAAGSLAGTASKVAGDVYEQGRRFARGAGDRYPDALRHSREGVESARHYASDNPVLTALAGFACGYALAWIIHRRSEEDGVPDYARMEQRYRRHQR